MTDPKILIDFLAFAEKLKTELRHSYTSAGREESVAEHTWSLCLLAMLIFPELAQEVNQLHVLKMLIVHDLPETITGDIPVFDKAAIIEQAVADEAEAMQTLTANLPESLKTEIITLWEEFETRETYEAKVAYAIDKMEAHIQHNAVDIATWDQNDIDYQTDLQHPRNENFLFDPFIKAMKAQIDHDTLAKLEAAGLLDKANESAKADFLAGKL